MTETHIGEIPSFLLAKQVVRVISYSLFHFHLFFGVIVLKKAAKKIHPQFSPVKQRWCLSSFHFNVESNSYSVWFCVSTFLALYWNTRTTGNCCKAKQSWLAHAHFPALHADHVVTLRFDWFTRLPVSSVTGYFVLDFDIELKFSLCSVFNRSQHAADALLLFLTTDVIFTGKPQTSVLLN